MDFHPAANLFPMMADAELNALERDIREYGQREPVVVFEHQILDGRNRYAACQAIGIEPLLTTVTEEDIGGDPIAYAVSANMRRRHLNPSQLAMVGAEVEKLYAVEAEKRMLTGKPDPRATLPQGRAREQAAEMVGVSGRSVQKANAVMEAGTESLSAAVSAGIVSVSAAEKLVRAVPDKEQQAAIVAEALESTTPAREIRRKISGGTSFDVED